MIDIIEKFKIIYMQPDYVEEEIKVYDVPSKLNVNVINHNLKMLGVEY